MFYIIVQKYRLCYVQIVNDDKVCMQGLQPAPDFEFPQGISCLLGSHTCSRARTTASASLHACKLIVEFLGAPAGMQANSDF